METTKYIQKNISFEVEDWEKLRRLAYENKMGISKILRELIKQIN